MSPPLDNDGGDGRDAATSVDGGGSDAPRDDDAGVVGDGGICRPGMTGADCAASCPDKMAGRECDYRRVLAIDLPAVANWNAVGDVPYTENATSTAGAFSRVGYRLILDAEEVWVELDTFTNDATKLGIPVDWLFVQPISNAIVLAFNSPTLPSHRLTPAEGNIEMYHHCYGEGDGGRYDSDDRVVLSEPHCYGSMQIHVERSPVLCINRWSEDMSLRLDLGIGVSPRGNPDWTFTGVERQKRRLEVYVR